MTTEQERWPLTGAWHAGPWTYAVSQRLHNHLNTLIGEARAHQRLAVDRHDWALMKQWDQYDTQLRAYRDELAARDEAAREQWRWECEQWDSRQGYVYARYSLWFNVLRRARGGDLAPDWRNHLKTYLDATARWRRQSDDVDALVIHELSTLPPQPWEPHAAGGDWRPALNAWYGDSLTQLDWYYRHVQSHWDSPKHPMLPQWADHAAQEACRAADAARCAALKYARERDELEAWYRAGLAAGGDDEDWHGWYRRRREDTWDQRDEIHHPPLRWGGPSIEHPFTLADEAEMQALPGYWLEKQAGIAARWVK